MTIDLSDISYDPIKDQFHQGGRRRYLNGLKTIIRARVEASGLAAPCDVEELVADSIIYLVDAGLAVLTQERLNKYLN